jgi:DNA-binding transcriptional regulator YiaG
MNNLTAEVLASRRLPPPSIARAIRVETGVSQMRMAVELGCVRGTVARWELGLRRPRGRLRLRYIAALEELERVVLAPANNLKV